MKRNILYQIKTLDRMLLRMFMQDNIDVKDFKLNVKPTRTQFIILSYLIEHHNNDIYQKDLEDVLNLRRATVSGVLHTMEKNALITRINDSNDTRTKKIILSKKAEEIFNKNKKRFQQIEDLVSKNISEEELDTFFSVINKMKNNLEDKDVTLK